MNQNDSFPYGFTELSDLRAYEAIRPEGTNPSQYWYQFWRGLTYLKKYYSKSDRCPAEMTSYFNAQRRLFPALREEVVPAESTTLGVIGDLMWIRDGWKSFMDPSARAILEGHDALFGNLETVLSPNIKVNRWLPDLVRYNSPPEYLDAFLRDDQTSMLSALSTTNNHTLDFGDAGALDTLRSLDTAGIAHSGVRQNAGDKRWVTVTAGPFTVGFVAASFGPNYPSDFAASQLAHHVIPNLAPETESAPVLDTIRDDLAEMANAGVDFRVVSLHWGFEYESHPTPRMMQIAREIVTAGADLVMGHHPHVQHPLEVIYVNQDAPESEPHAASMYLRTPDARPRRALIAYSLGNFTTTMVTTRCQLGLLLSIRLVPDPSGGAAWKRPISQWFYNVAPFIKKGDNLRRLIPVEKLSSELRDAIEQDLERTQHHVDGS